MKARDPRGDCVECGCVMYMQVVSNLKRSCTYSTNNSSLELTRERLAQEKIGIPVIHQCLPHKGCTRFFCCRNSEVVMHPYERRKKAFSLSLSPSVLISPLSFCPHTLDLQSIASRANMTSPRRRRNAVVLLVPIFHSTSAFMTTTSNRFYSRAAAGIGNTALPVGSVGVRGAETRIFATGFFESLFAGLKVSTHTLFGGKIPRLHPLAILQYSS